MKRILIVCLAVGALLALVASASGCGSSATANSANLSQDSYNKIDTGATADAVRAVAGNPARVEKKTVSQMPGMVMNGDMTVEYWYYQGSKGWVRFEVTDGKVTNKSGY
ncbi:MAG: hypothetical protein ACYC6Z_10285 [Thermoleophilia bacterium]